MRSRYSAYFFRLIDYLIETTHPETRKSDLRRELEDSIHYYNWAGLEILSTSKGQKEDKRGKVEFEVICFFENERQELYEHSRFKRYKGGWKYLDAKG